MRDFEAIEKWTDAHAEWSQASARYIELAMRVVADRGWTQQALRAAEEKFEDAHKRLIAAVDRL